MNPEGGNYETTELLGDAVRIYQILSNILSNALKFTHRGGITITFCITDSAIPESSERFLSCSFFCSFLINLLFFFSPNPTNPMSAHKHHTTPPFSSPFPYPSPSPSPSPNINPSSSHPSSHFPFPPHHGVSILQSSPSSPTSPNFIFPIIPGTTPRTESPITPHPVSPRNGNAEPFRENTPCLLTILIHDTGIGMSQEEQARIFKRFSQANNRTSHVCLFSFFFCLF